MTFSEIRQELINNAEEEFKNFTAKIVLTKMPMLGVRTPTVKKLAKEADESYLTSAPHYYEEVLVYGFALGRLKPRAKELFENLPRYLGFVDSWAAIDSPLSGMKAFKKEKEQCLSYIDDYLYDEREYFARFAAVALFNYIDETHIDGVIERYATVTAGRYYVDMAIAWGLSIVAIDFYDKVYAALKEGRFSDFITRKTVSKCRDSFRIPSERKKELKELLQKQ